MNFYGHARVAALAARGSDYVLGAMLPDLARMARARLVAVRGTELAAGIALHHRSDAVFHRGLAFRQLLATGSAALQLRGLRRGPARAAAHVGIELLLDGAVAIDRVARDRFAAALQAGASAGTGEALVWGNGGAKHFAILRARLGRSRIPELYREDPFVAERVAWVLGSRRRLALDPGEERQLRGWLGELRPAVDGLASRLLAGVIEDLGHGPAPRIPD